MADQGLLADFVANNATDGCTTDRTNATTTGQNRTADCTDTGADCRILLLRRHPGAGAQAEQHDRGQRAKREFSSCFHGKTYSIKSPEGDGFMRS
jgi:hypothetical protein